MLIQICKLKVLSHICANCNTIGELLDDIPNCIECGLNKKRYRLLAMSPSGDEAIVLSDGRVEQVAMHRVYDIKEIRA